MYCVQLFTQLNGFWQKWCTACDFWHHLINLVQSSVLLATFATILWMFPKVVCHVREKIDSKIALSQVWYYKTFNNTHTSNIFHLISLNSNLNFPLQSTKIFFQISLIGKCQLAYDYFYRILRKYFFCAKWKIKNTRRWKCQSKFNWKKF